MEVLFIGGTGNISTECVDLLLKEGHAVSVLTRGRNPVPAGVNELNADRNDAAALSAVLKNSAFDVVINFLGFTPQQIDLDWEVLKGRTAHYVFISSCTVYAKPHQALPLREESPTGNRFSEYARNKAACEERLHELHDAQSFPVTIVRPSHTYSKRWLPNVVSSAGFTFGRRLLDGKAVFVPGDGQSLWTLTAAEDFAVGLAGLLGCERAFGEVFHITSDEALTWNQIYRETAWALNEDSPRIVPVPVDTICAACPALTAGIKGDKAGHAVFDNAKIKQVVRNFECKTSFRAGVKRAVEWFASNPEMMSADAAVDAKFDAVLKAVE